VAAEKMVQAGLKILGLKQESLAEMRKGSPEKVALAAWIRERTTVPLRWVSERLDMGHSGNASQGIRKLIEKDQRRVRQMKELLEKMSRE
jgi:hypothetical protein